MKLTFDNKTAVVTGASRGIGLAIARQLASEGVKIACVSRNPAGCEAAAESIRQAGGQAEAFPCDVSDAAQVEEKASRILESFGRVDILVNNAGITKDGLMLRMSPEAWGDVLRTNLDSCFYWCRYLTQPMTRARWGRIINMGSVSGVMGNAGQVNYSAAKAGLIGLTKSLARELASRSITANLIAPGFIDTDMTAELSQGDMADKILANIPLKRFGKVEDIANLATFLASEEASYITGQVFSVDGGMAI